MKTITEKAVSNFLNGKNFKSSNTVVEIQENKSTLKLHNNSIAILENNKLSISNCGWFSNTTKERLNGLPNVTIKQKKGIWYLNEIEWDGNLIEIK